jgi:hypothetical protein
MGGNGDILKKVREVLRRLSGSHQVTKKMVFRGI